MEPCTYVIFGATGHLSQTKLLPSLYHLESAGRLPEGVTILGIGRRDWTDDAWRDEVKGLLGPVVRNGIDEGVWEAFSRRLHFFEADLNDEAAYEALCRRLADEPQFSDNMIFYMAIRPADFEPVSRNIARVGLNSEENGWRRLVVEKPFGYDLESAELLNRSLHRDFEEHQIFRIDHYLGKETVQNVLVFRFANLMLEPLWNRNYIDHVQITHSEDRGLEGRAYYYDGSGALRDMIQSHLLQMLTLVAMEPPASLDAEALRDEKVKVLRSIRPIPNKAVHAHAFRAQYGRGRIDGKKVPGYLDLEGVPPDSTTETYAALKVYIDNWRWSGVPFYLRTGKRMARDSSLISIRFKNPPQQLFRETHIEHLNPNWVLLGIQPHECLRAEVQVKQPGLEMLGTRTARLDASYDAPVKLDAYEALLLDVISGDRSLFLRYDEVSWAWRVVDPILKVWSTERNFINTYPAGSWGPPESQRLFDEEDQFWRNEVDVPPTES